MLAPPTDTIPDLLLRNIPRNVLMAVEEGLTVGAGRAYAAARGMDEGHLPHIVGQLRHFHMNEAFHRALAANEAAPSPIRGSGVVTGRTGVTTLARFNAREGVWNSGKRSQTRRQMSLANASIEPLVQPELFREYVPPADAVVFFVACFANTLHISPEAPVSIQLAVPDRFMQRWLFKESLSSFVERYGVAPAQQSDAAIPKLKKNLNKQQDKDGTTE